MVRRPAGSAVAAAPKPAAAALRTSSAQENANAHASMKANGTKAPCSISAAKPKTYLPGYLGEERNESCVRTFTEATAKCLAIKVPRAVMLTTDRRDNGCGRCVAHRSAWALRWSRTMVSTACARARKSNPPAAAKPRGSRSAVRARRERRKHRHFGHCNNSDNNATAQARCRCNPWSASTQSTACAQCRDSTPARSSSTSRCARCGHTCCPVHVQACPSGPVQALMDRVTPGLSKLFVIDVVLEDVDMFEVANAGPGGRGGGNSGGVWHGTSAHWSAPAAGKPGKILLRGTSTVALASAYNTYLRVLPLARARLRPIPHARRLRPCSTLRSRGQATTWLIWCERRRAPLPARLAHACPNNPPPVPGQTDCAATHRQPRQEPPPCVQGRSVFVCACVS
jgi:hypothetical protein